MAKKLIVEVFAATSAVAPSASSACNATHSAISAARTRFDEEDDEVELLRVLLPVPPFFWIECTSTAGKDRHSGATCPTPTRWHKRW